MDEKLILGCKKRQRDAQRQVYEQISKKLYYTCKRYIKKEEEIEEVLADSFYSIFTKIDQLKEIDAFEAWTRKITINKCLHHLKRNINFNLYIEETKLHLQPQSLPETNLEEEDLLNLLNFIPDGCKTIFNLFVIEGYGHKEIASMLQISEGTSKSQLNVAKTKLKELVNNHYYQTAK